MSDWALAELGDLAELKMGQSPPGSLVSELRDGLPFLQGNAEFGVQSPQPRYQCDQAPQKAEPGDSLISVRAPVGAVNVADQGYGIGRGLAAVRFTRLNDRFGYLALQQATILLDRVCQGTTFAAIGRAELASLPLPVPPLNEQLRIAEILDTIDESIQAAERVIAKHERVRVGLVTDLLSQSAEVDHVQDRKLDRSCNDEQLREDQQDVLNNRVCARLLEVVESMVDGPFGSNLKTEHYVQRAGVRVVRLANLGEGHYLNEDEAFIEEDRAKLLSRHDVRNGDILVASLGDDNHRPGRACRYPDEFAPGIVKADCFRIRPSGSVDQRFLVEMLNSEDVASQIRRLAQGVTRDRINLTQLRRVVVQIPPLEEQQRVTEVLDSLDQAIYEYQEQLGKLQKLRSGLADDLLSCHVSTGAA